MGRRGSQVTQRLAPAVPFVKDGRGAGAQWRKDTEMGAGPVSVRGDSRDPAQPGSEMKTDTWGLAVLRTFNSGGTRGRKLGEKYSASRPSSRGCRGRVPPFLGAHTAVGGRERPLPGLGNQEGRPEREGASQGPLAVSQSVSLFTI